MTLSKPKSQEKTTRHLMLKSIALVSFIGVFLWALIYPFWMLDSSNTKSSTIKLSSSDSTSIDAKQHTTLTLSQNSNQTLTQIAHGDMSENILTADIDPFAPEFNNDYPIPDFKNMTDVKTKKSAYFNFIRHFARQNNAILLQKRAFIQDQANKLNNIGVASLAREQFINEYLTDSEQEKITFLIKEYRIKDQSAAAMINRLLLLVHTVPVELIQVQTANESGWGTSRFATQGYNYFGLWCYQKGCGFVPSQRNEGASHEVAKFTSPAEGMYQYIRNLNRNHAYRDLRTTRVALFDDPNTRQDSYARAMALTQTLGAYSERGEDYIDELQSMLRVNKPFLVNSAMTEKSKNLN